MQNGQREHKLPQQIERVLTALIGIKGKTYEDVTNFAIIQWVGDHLPEIEKYGISTQEPDKDSQTERAPVKLTPTRKIKMPDHAPKITTIPEDIYDNLFTEELTNRKPVIGEMAPLLGKKTDSAISKRNKRPKRNIPPHGRTLSKEEIELLGTIPDRKLAPILKISTKTISKMRRKHNIRKCPKKYSLTTKQEKLLGKMPDRKLARRLHCTIRLVTKTRNHLGIAPYRKKKTFAKRHRELLGTMIDKDLARLTGLSLAYITLSRINAGIPSFQFQQRQRKLDIIKESIQRGKSIKETAAATRSGLSTVKRMSNRLNTAKNAEIHRLVHPVDQATIDLVLPLLGKKSDSKIAKQTGVPLNMVNKLRLMNDIPRYNALKNFPEKLVSRLGTMPDKQLAKISGMTQQQIRYKRDSLNIPPYHPNAKRKEP